MRSKTAGRDNGIWGSAWLENTPFSLSADKRTPFLLQARTLVSKTSATKTPRPARWHASCLLHRNRRQPGANRLPPSAFQPHLP